MNKIILILSICIIISCQESKNHCKENKLTELLLKPFRISVKMPKYKIIDSTIYGGSNTILNYKIKSLDNSIELIVFIDDQKDFIGRDLRIENITGFQKMEVESTSESRTSLLNEHYKQIQHIKVGYLKYLIEKKNEKYFESRIYFYKENKLVVIWIFEKFISEVNNSYSKVDCILDSINFY